MFLERLKKALRRFLYPDSGVVAYTYDFDGKLTTKTDQKGQVTSFEYNTRDLLTTAGASVPVVLGADFHRGVEGAVSTDHPTFLLEKTRHGLGK
ncbi:MAG: hypothetical protein V1809_16195 [Planctomycetota bacterium]